MSCQPTMRELASSRGTCTKTHLSDEHGWRGQVLSVRTLDSEGIKSTSSERFKDRERGDRRKTMRESDVGGETYR